MTDPSEDGGDVLLWEALHDADLVLVASDALARTVAFEFDILHLRQFEHLPATVRWRIIVEGAKLLLARAWQPWVGPCPPREGLSREEQSRIVTEYQSKGRTVSIGWDEFERIVAEQPLDIGDATIKHQAGAVATLVGYGHGAADRYCEFEVVGDGIRCERSDAGQVALEDLRRLGERYWEAFAARRP